ncbi:MAG: sigma E positive regulator RseC/MucC [Halomonadaceae bacterium]|nr:MAG: sigma E positive regulator RseC/MucC [Halomonadaceae bacterium]
MIEETGTVVAVTGDQVWVQRLGQGLCAQCSARGGCGQGAMTRLGGGDRTRRLQLPNRLVAEQGQPAAVGDQVVMGIAEQALLTASALVYLLPLLLMLGAAVLADVLSPAGDGVTVLAGVSGLALGFALAAFCQRRFRSSPRLQPQLLRRAAPAETGCPQTGQS